MAANGGAPRRVHRRPEGKGGEGRRPGVGRNPEDGEKREPPVRVLLVSPDPRTLDELGALSSSSPLPLTVDVCADVGRGLELATDGRVDLLVVDADLPDPEVFEVLERSAGRGPPEVVLVAASDRFTLAAYDAGVLDYVLKPLSEARLRLALERATERVGLRRLGRTGRHLGELLSAIAGPSPDTGQRPLTRLVAKTGERVDFIPVEAVDRITAEDYYVRVHTPEDSYLLRDSLSSLQERLPPGLFVRTHRSALVNVRRLRSLVETEDGRKEAVLADGSRVPVARSRTSMVVDAVGGGAP